jgi:hypothetical protein
VSDEGYIIRGPDAEGIATRTGDSGSPMYRTIGTAVGIHNTTSGGFAKLGDALAATGTTYYK